MWRFTKPSPRTLFNDAPIAAEGHKSSLLVLESGDLRSWVPTIPPPRAFTDWLESQGKTKNTIKQIVNYTKRFSSVLETGDVSPLTTLSPRNKYHALNALAKYSKFIGCYDRFLQIKQRHL